MLFDRLCMIAERHHPVLIPALKAARLFDFPVRAHEAIPQQPSEEERQFLTDTFFLPFPIVAIEDKGTCVVLMDNVDGQQGWEEERNFIDIVPCLPDDPTAFDDGKEQGLMPRAAMEAYLPPELHDAYVVSFGRIGHPAMREDGLCWRFEVDLAFCANKSRIVMNPMEIARRADSFERFKYACGKNARAALSEVMLFNAPNRFVVEKRLVREKKPPRDDMVARSHERAQYTLLRPGEIRERLGLAESGGSTKEPHERRRHFRTLRDKRYTKMRGKTITVPACWVGPSEATVGKHRYKVMLDI